ncbi:MAG: branched-chain-amino-acid transaminase [Candidatus Zixiibacteriota bacterium]
MTIAYFDDRFVDESEALIPVSTHALHYGTAVFEGIRSYGDGVNAAIFRPREHYERFLRNAALIRMQPAYTVDQLIDLTIELLHKNKNYSSTYIRPLLYKSSTAIGAHIYPGEKLTIYTREWTPRPIPPPTATATISRWRRNSHLSVPAGAKISGLYVNSSIAISESMDRGFDQTIMLTTTGEVAEGYGANLFAVFGKRVVTPPESADILAGITRDTLIHYFNSRDDLTMSVESMTPEKLATADELFLAGTGLEVIPLVSIDHKPIGNGDLGPITRDAARWYRDLVTGKIDGPDGWLVPLSAS